MVKYPNTSSQGCSGLCDRSLGEVQRGEGHRGLHQEGDGQKVADVYFLQYFGGQQARKLQATLVRNYDRPTHRLTDEGEV